MFERVFLRRSWREKVMGSPSELNRDQLEFVKTATQRQVSYKVWWWVHTLLYNGLSLVIVAGAAVISVLVNIPAVSPLILTIIGGSVAVGGAVSNFYNFRERRQIYRFGLVQLEQEIRAFKLGTGVYANLDKSKAFLLF